MHLKHILSASAFALTLSLIGGVSTAPTANAEDGEGTRHPHHRLVAERLVGRSGVDAR